MRRKIFRFELIQALLQLIHFVLMNGHGAARARC